MRLAATDKGNSRPDFYRDGRRPGDAVAEWNERTAQLARAARQVVAQRQGRAPRRTYATGISHGGYLTRRQLENHPEPYDGGVDWESALRTEGGPNLLTSLPVTVPQQLGAARGEDLYAAGFARGSEFLWPYHAKAYGRLTQKIYRAEFSPSCDPACPGPSAGGALEEILTPCASDSSYDYTSRPASVRRAVARVALSGRIGRPLITLHGDLDAAADGGRLGGVRADGGRERTRTVPPLLRGGGRYACRRAVRHLAAAAAADPALLPLGVHGAGGVGGEGCAAARGHTIARPAHGDVVDTWAVDRGV